jgi:hypothetical protein
VSATRGRSAALLLIASALLVACTPGADPAADKTDAASTSTSAESPTTSSPPPSAPTPPPLAPRTGALAFTIQRANVRPDGTLVLDIRPIGVTPETVQSYGPVSLTLDGAPGVLDLTTAVGDLTLRVIVTGRRNDQVVVQVLDGSGRVLESAFLAADKPAVDSWIDVTAGETIWSDPVVTLSVPTPSRPGTVTVTGTLTVAGISTPVDRVIARWSLPSRR